MRFLGATLPSWISTQLAPARGLKVIPRHHQGYHPDFEIQCGSLSSPSSCKKSKRDASLYIASWDRERYVRQIHGLTGECLQLSNEHGIGCTVVSLTVPGIQGIADKTEAEETATVTNNWIAEQIKEHRDRLGAFSRLSMHNVQAGQELRRCVKDLGFHGVLLCDFQHAGPNGETYLFYDQPHNGVFGRFPTAKVIIGHLREHIPFDFCRINHWLQDVDKPIAEDKGKFVCKKTVYDYFKQDICITTGGHFSTATLKYVVDEIGADRVLFSIDYPYETIENGCGWWDNGAKALQEAVGGIDLYHCISQGNAKKLLKLGDFHDSEAPVN
ncbi:amidohydrolase family protein [Aspergillus fischeri NRRL 181]|uniref:Amidohydrolase family protein n=1 Tax=Neosartorya fischeri (strain ATCC 1020 / DSM 3700 / CBS 544.65 / FGSC A1164 / JCM 1740 / NRRL 181 / WB 181) TaxID=331117 RepID=A1CX87_NEOFI|nr:amidohydrolase family protein [Aspergillus fischeri NRRL 181]EAW25239.1 amidohydrolase family protein [Aspergillus fischeri NRRL 181]